MPDRLPPDLITRIKPLLLPHVRSVDEREALFIETFFLRDPRPLDQVDFRGSAEVFVVRCIADLLQKVGCLAETGERLHSLSALLLTIREKCGEEHRTDIDFWLPILNRQCVAPSIVPSPATPVTLPPQSIATPTAERTASVFISYSHDDESFATDLIGKLGEAGHVCWIDTSRIKGGTDWQRAICDGINLSYALVVVCTHKGLESEYVWDEIQWARTRRKLIIPVLLEDVTEDDRFFGLHRYQGIRFDKLAHSQAMAALIAALPSPLQIDPRMPPRPAMRRELELTYLDRLRFDDFRLEKFELKEYVALGGVAQARRETPDSWEAVAMQQEFAVLPGVKQEGHEQEEASEPFTDAVSRITELRRVVVLGEPGAGKTHTLRAIAKPLYTAALADETAPIPVLVKLGKWDQPDMPFEAYLRAELGELGAYLDDLLQAERAVLLFDGLNEFPADQRATKYPQVEAYIKAHQAASAVVTCREADYPISLHLTRVLLRPLDPPRILDFAVRALRLKGEQAGETFFWKLAGGKSLREVWEKWEAAGASFELFWSATNIPRERFNVYNSTTWSDDALWRQQVHSPASLMRLAANPFMLAMLLDVYIQFQGELPINRGQLFEQFVSVLLTREKLVRSDPATKAIVPTDEGYALLSGLERAAFEMQTSRVVRALGGESSAGTSLPHDMVRQILSDRLLYLAVSTGLLQSSGAVRFSHQLLQEYFAARFMDREFHSGRLKAADIWRPWDWWKKTNWEEAAVLLAGLYSDDTTPILDWLADANPEVAVLCIVRSGANTPDLTRTRLRDKWLARLAGARDRLMARVVIGRALGMFTVGESMADNRPGVGLGPDGLPDIVWCPVTGNTEWIYQDKPHPPLPPYRIAKYPITYAQYKAFINAPDGYHDTTWWKDLHKDAGDQKEGGLKMQHFQFDNHPAENVSWYDAMAFCAWLSAKLGQETRLPNEREWERAARGTDGRGFPYPGRFDPAKGNTYDTGIRQTSAVGIFLGGQSPVSALDMSGNVWEWCLNEYESGEVSVGSRQWRAARGGAWDVSRNFARTSYRGGWGPASRSGNQGFRVVCATPVSPPASDL